MSSHLSTEGRWTCLENVGHKAGTEGEAIIGGVILPWPLSVSWPRWSEQLPPLHFFDSAFMPYLCLKLMVPASHGLIIYLPPLSWPSEILCHNDRKGLYTFIFFNAIFCNFSWDFFLWLVWKYTFFTQCLRIFLAVFLLMIFTVAAVDFIVLWEKLWHASSCFRSTNEHKTVQTAVSLRVCFMCA